MEHRKKHLHPGALWSFRVGGIVASFFFVLFFGGFFGQFVFALFAIGSGAPDAVAIVLMALFMLFMLFVFTVVIAEVYARMSYNRWFYEFGEDSLKLERGIIWKKYSNVPYERVQNVDIHRGIIARLAGFSGVAIQTAGFSYSRNGMPSAEGSIPAVSIHEAEEIREFLMKKISRKSRENKGI